MTIEERIEEAHMTISDPDYTRAETDRAITTIFDLALQLAWLLRRLRWDIYHTQECCPKEATTWTECICGLTAWHDEFKLLMDGDEP